MRTVVLILFSVLLVGMESAQAFCGFYVAKGDTKLFNKASKVVLVRDGERTVLTMANDFKGDFKEFAIVIPVPTKLERDQIHVTEGKYIDHLDAYSAPRLVEYFDADPCAPQVMYEMLAGAPSSAVRQKSSHARADSLGVKIEAEYTVGEYDIVILSAEQSNGLQTWLDESGYKIPEGAGPVLQSYIRQGNKFFVAKVNLKEQGKLGFSYLRPIQIAFESPKFMLPIRLGTVNSDGTQDLFIFALTKKGRVESTNYRTIKIQEGLDIPLYIKDDFGPFYKAVFDESVRKEDMRALFLEYAWDMGWCDPCASEPLSNDELRELGVFWVGENQNSRYAQGMIAPQPQNVFLTRLHVRYDAAHFPEDLTFQETSDRQNFQAKYVLRHRFSGGEMCAARNEYDRSLPQRAETEAQNLVRLTGWEIEEVRKKIGVVKSSDSGVGVSLVGKPLEKLGRVFSALLFGGIFFGALEVLTSGALNLSSALLDLSFDAAAGAILGILITSVLFLARGKVTLTALLLTALMLFVLKPLFIGHAMVLVFTVPQTVAIALGTAVLLLIGLCLVLKILVADAVTAPNRFILFLFSTLACCLLIRVNSVFLVRLWGFATMEYLQIASLGIALVVAALPFAGWLSTDWKLSGGLCLLTLSIWIGSWITLLPQSDNISSLSSKFPNAGLALTTLSQLFDRDGDGFSALFGFGDCDDRDPKVNPRAIDWPSNGQDENCFGGDLGTIKFPAFNTPIKISPPLERSKRRQVVLLLALDTLRADYVNYALSANDSTPNLARVAAESTRFLNAYAQSNNTLESFPFVLHLGYRNLPGYNRDWSLATILRRGGVDSAAVLQASVEKWWSGDLDSVLFGFDRVARGEPTSRSRDAIETAKLALTELGRSSKRDSFVFLHFEALHDYFTQNMQGSRIVNKGVNISELIQLGQMQAMLEIMQQRYGAVLTKLDRAVGVIWEGIKELEKGADVTLIVISDHGEEFFEHGGLFHMGTLYDELLRVPLLIYRTGVAAQVKAAPVALYQIPPTVLDALHFEGDYIKKTSLLSGEAMPPDLFALFSLQELDNRRSFSLIDGDLKFIYNQERGSVALFDLKADPHESRSVANDAAYAEARTKLTQRMDALMFYMNYGDQELIKRTL